MLNGRNFLQPWTLLVWKVLFATHWENENRWNLWSTECSDFGCAWIFLCCLKSSVCDIRDRKRVERTLAFRTDHRAFRWILLCCLKLILVTHSEKNNNFFWPIRKKQNNFLTHSEKNNTPPKRRDFRGRKFGKVSFCKTEKRRNFRGRGFFSRKSFFMQQKFRTDGGLSSADLFTADLRWRFDFCNAALARLNSPPSARCASFLWLIA